MSVASQQRTVLLEYGVDDNPRQVFLDDMTMEVTEWKELGGHVIVMGDFNDDLRAGDVKTTFEELNMVEAITSQNEGMDLPATFKHNLSQEIIDGMWTTRGIQSSEIWTIAQYGWIYSSFRSSVIRCSQRRPLRQDDSNYGSQQWLNGIRKNTVDSQRNITWQCK